MSASKHIDKICCVIFAACLVLTILFVNAASFGVQPVSADLGYASRLFNTSAVHTIDIVMNDWDSFTENCTDENYTNCTVVIDGESYRNVAIRAKGNTSLTSVKSYGNDRYSFKIEFDHYDDSVSYYGLDKLCLNNIIQDNTYMKDYIVYRMMDEFGVDAPLCSYSYITVNGEDWGLYLAVEGVEESFLERNYGSDYGQLYKPDSMDMGDRPEPGNGFDAAGKDTGHSKESEWPKPLGKPDNSNPVKPEGRGDMSPHMGSSDVTLVYTDDACDSYSNIFDSAKTNISDADKTRFIASLKNLNNMENLENTVNIEEVIRYFVVHNFVLNFDSYTGSMIHNYYLYEKDGQLSMIPWDYNLAFGGFESQTDATGLANYPIDTPVSGGTVDSRPMLAWILNNEDYTELYHQYFTEFIETYFGNGRFEEIIDATQEIIAPYVQKDPTKFCTYEEFEQGVSTLKKFCALRAESISGQLNGTIPSTTQGQKADASSIIDANGITIADMGTMDNMMNRSKMPEHFDNRPEPSDYDDIGIPAGKMDLGFAPPDRQDSQAAFSLILLGASSAILFSGILAAHFYHRRKRIL